MRQEVQRLTTWCFDNNLVLKTKVRRLWSSRGPEGPQSRDLSSGEELTQALNTYQDHHCRRDPSRSFPVCSLTTRTEILHLKTGTSSIWNRSAQSERLAVFLSIRRRLLLNEALFRSQPDTLSNASSTNVCQCVAASSIKNLNSLRLRS